MSVETKADDTVHDAQSLQKIPDVSSSDTPQWPDITPDHPLFQLNTHLMSLIETAESDEVYGIHLATASPFHRKLILQKFLRANANDIGKAKTQLLETLRWRKTFDPRKAMTEIFSRTKFGGLGWVTTLHDVPGSTNPSDTATFNIYGAVKNSKTTFGDLDTFLRWRVALMELSVAQLQLEKATRPIPDYGAGPDPYQGFQIHDYLSVSFLRQDAHQRAAAKAAIDLFQKYYPETLSRKFFVNVPIIMGWMFTAMKMVMSVETAKKFTVLTYGKDLALELGKDVPVVYGGENGSLEFMAKGLQMEG